MHVRTLQKHNASGYYVGRNIKNVKSILSHKDHNRHFLNPQLDTSLHCKTQLQVKPSASCGDVVCLFMSQLSLVHCT